MTKGKVKGQAVDTAADIETLSKDAEKDLTPEAIEELSNGKGDDEDE